MYLHKKSNLCWLCTTQVISSCKSAPMSGPLKHAQNVTLVRAHNRTVQWLHMRASCQGDPCAHCATAGLPHRRHISCTACPITEYACHYFCSCLCCSRSFSRSTKSSIAFKKSATLNPCTNTTNERHSAAQLRLRQHVSIMAQNSPC